MLSKPSIRHTSLPKQTLFIHLSVVVVMVFLCSGLAAGLPLIFGSVYPALDQVQNTTLLVQNIHTSYMLTERFLVSGSHTDFVAAEQALTDLDQALRALLAATNMSIQREVLELSTLQHEELNGLRSLNILLNAAGAAASRDAIRQSIDATSKMLNQAANNLLDGRTEALRRTFDTQLGFYEHLQLVGLGLVLLTIVLMVILSLLQIHRTQASLNVIICAANKITEGDFSVRAKLERPDAFGQLAIAFNQMADSLKKAIHTEAAANSQNRQQLLKLARQERMTAILKERHRIARELHDSVKQQLFSITLAAGAALNLLEHDLNMARTYLEHVQQTGNSAQAEMTGLLQEMWPISLQDRHLEEALLQYLTPLCEIHQLKLLWRVEGTNALTIAQEHALFRVVQEAVGNVIRHSQATRLRISLRFGLQTWLVIEDNGRGFDPQSVPPTSNGLSMMRLRLKQVGGSLSIQSNNGGTRLEIIMDLLRGKL